MSIDNTFLGDMQTTVTGKVECFTKYQIDGSEQKGGSLWVSKPNTGRNPDIIGNELIKIACPHELFLQQQEKLKAGEITIPGVFQILASIDMGDGNRAKLTALSVIYQAPPDSKSDNKNQGTQTANQASQQQKP